MICHWWFYWDVSGVAWRLIDKDWIDIVLRAVDERRATNQNSLIDLSIVLRLSLFAVYLSWSVLRMIIDHSPYNRSHSTTVSFFFLLLLLLLLDRREKMINCSSRLARLIFGLLTSKSFL